MIVQDKLSEAQTIATDESRCRKMQETPEHLVRSGERQQSREQEGISGRQESTDRNSEPLVRSTRDRGGAGAARESRALRNPLHVPQASGHSFSQTSASHTRPEDLDYRGNHEEAKEEGSQPRADSRSTPGARINGPRIPSRDTVGAGGNADGSRGQLRPALGSANKQRADGELFGANRSLSRGSYIRDDQTDEQEDLDDKNWREAHGAPHHRRASIREELGDHERFSASNDPANGGPGSQDQRGNDVHDRRYSYPSFQPSPGRRSGAQVSADQIRA